MCSDTEMSGSFSSSSLSVSPVSKGKERSDNPEMRWRRRRGGYEIEKQCPICKWWFDSFDMERKLCNLCLEQNPQQTPSANASMPTTAGQQSEVPQAMIDLFDMSGVEDTQLGNTQQYPAYGQGFGATSNPAFSPETLPGLPEWQNTTSQMWPMDYDVSYGSSDFTMSDPVGGYMPGHTNMPGYVTSPDLAIFNEPTQYEQNLNMASYPPFSYGSLPALPGGYTQNQNYYQGGASTSSFSSPPQQTNEWINPNRAGPSAPKFKPLRPLLPREPDAPPPPPPPPEPEPEGDDDDDDDEDSQHPESASYRAWLKKSPSYRNAIRKHKKKNEGKKLDKYRRVTK